ncbi:hypothetical protein HDV02_003297 [Globomyces sp. JEL0801]|nr:hypothetical protein HDV02_003297 [Globomyces sp. JEL0801]
MQDKSRQTILNLLCFLSVFTLAVYYYTNQTLEVPILNDLCLLFFSICIQYGLMMLLHNSIVKLINGLSNRKNILEMINKYILVIYIIPIVPLAFIGLSIKDAQSKHMPARDSVYNTQYYKPLTVFLVISINVLASIADYLLMNKVLALKESLSPNTSNAKRQPKTFGSKSLSLRATYNIILVLVSIDVLMKILVIVDVPVFDSVVTVTSLAFRSAANLKFGTTLRNIYKPESSESSTSNHTKVYSNYSESGRNHSRIEMKDMNVNIFQNPLPNDMPNNFPSRVYQP